MTSFHPRRSVLYMPGSNARAMAKARDLPADALIFDLEDAVAPEQKTAARDQVCKTVLKGGFGRREVIVRVNDLNSDWGLADLEAVTKAKPDAVLLPKIKAAEDIRAVEKRTDLALWAMMETAEGILNASAIAGASPRLACLVAGTNDLARELRVQDLPDRSPLLISLQLCVLAARAHGLAVIDGVFNTIKDPQGFEAECRQGRACGFDGKTVIHPAQLETANRIFSPSEYEIEQANRIIGAFQQASADGKGIAVLDGRMIEDLHKKEAERILAFARSI